MASHLRSVLAMALCLGVSSLAQSGDAGRESRPGVYRGYSAIRYTEWIKSSEYVAVRDGTRLAVDIYRPAQNGKVVEERLPVIWTHTPYRRAFLTSEGKSNSAVDRPNLLEILQYGYVVAAVDTRGRGASFGVRRGFQDRTEALDAYDMTEWFASRPWSDGNIGIVGCSYVGGSTFHAATTAPPHLRAIAPGCTDFDKYGFVSRGGLTAQFNTRPEDPGQDYGYGVLPVDSDPDGKLAAEAIASHAAGTPMAELWRGMPFRDDISPLLGVPYWKEVSLVTYIKQIERSNVGIFIWGNWRDEGSFEATLAFNNLRNPRKLWMGGWGHCQIGDFPMATELLRFFDHFLKRVDNGWEREPPVYFHTINAPQGQEWQSSRQWPLAETRTAALHFDGAASPGIPGSMGLATTQPPATASDQFAVNYAPVCKENVDPNFMFWPCVITNHGLSYATAPLAADVQITGHPVVDLWIAATTPDADVFVYLEDVAPAGDVSIISHGRLRASHRLEQSTPYRNYMGLPYHRGNRSDVKPLTPGEPSRLRMDLLPTSIIVKAGHRLRLTVAGADPRQRSRNVSYDPAPVITVFRDSRHASGLTLPVMSKPAFATSPAVQLPQVVGPVAVTATSQPYAAANIPGAPSALDLAASGYTEEEYFISGQASEYVYDEQFTVNIARSGIPYTTRLLIRRPSDPQRFSGVVHLESAHPVQGNHLMWPAGRRYMMSQGDAYAVLVTGEDALTRGGYIAPEREALRTQAQASGKATLGAITVLRRFDPQRYAPLVWPDNDAPRWDALAQTAALLKSGAPQSPLAGFAVKRLYAEGWSFTGSLLRTFINEGFHDRTRMPDGRPVIDGYLIGISSSTFVSGVVALTTGTAPLPIGHARRVTRSLDVPVIELMTENEAVTNTGPQAPDNDSGNGRHRLYEVPGLTHGDGLVAQGFELTSRYQLMQKGLVPQPPADACTLEHSDVPMGSLASAALANLDAWVTRGLAPPPSQRIPLDPVTHVVLRDAFGNAGGGVRIAELDVPLAVYAEPGPDASKPCRDLRSPFQKIRRQPFNVDRLVEEYASKEGFVKRFDTRLKELVADRWLLAEDAASAREAARRRIEQVMGPL